ncbi:hypothetical protein EDC04DRAFT_405376 [Pisolithus marmoratus]|nr:hypothetical protein EDC04DRAFT_405376 [Pisolithus marmoratus]
MESFPYVLVLFFFSYAKPLEEEALRRVRVQGSSNPLQLAIILHVAAWPAMFEQWASSTFQEISERKYFALAPASHRSIQPRTIGRFILNCWTMFCREDRQVEHAQFIKVLRE